MGRTEGERSCDPFTAHLTQSNDIKGVILPQYLVRPGHGWLNDLGHARYLSGGPPYSLAKLRWLAGLSEGHYGCTTEFPTSKYLVSASLSERHGSGILSQDVQGAFGIQSCKVQGKNGKDISNTREENGKE